MAMLMAIFMTMFTAMIKTMIITTLTMKINYKNFKICSVKSLILKKWCF